MLRLGNFLRGAVAPVRSVAASVSQRLSSSGHTSGGASTDDDDYDDEPDSDEPDEPDEASLKNKGGRPRGASGVERVLIGEFASKAEAIKAGERAAVTDTHRTSGVSWDYAATCSRHRNCPVGFLVKAMEGAKDRPAKACKNDVHVGAKLGYMAVASRDGDSLFAVSRPTNFSDATPTRVTAFLNTFTLDPTVPAEITEAHLGKVLAIAATFYLVTISPVESPAEENGWIAVLVGDNRDKVREVFLLPDAHAGRLSCTCTSPMFAHSGEISVEILMVLVDLGLIKLDVLVTSIVARNRVGRPESKTKCKLDAKSGKYYDWRAVVTKDGKGIVGVVRLANKPSRTADWLWPVEFKDGSEEELNAAQLAEALYKASEADVMGPSK
ncbi:hypothetical protein M885DRAFT_571495 [Pelagophyceae sp. CCMP2097]|nr:hypothetical protein M885DRAFT_571495 [Pelagophyceae sp. CCMP2097]